MTNLLSPAQASKISIETRSSATSSSSRLRINRKPEIQSAMLSTLQDAHNAALPPAEQAKKMLEKLASDYVVNPTRNPHEDSEQIVTDFNTRQAKIAAQENKSYMQQAIPNGRPAEQVIQKLIELPKNLGERWEAHQAHQTWVTNGSVGDAPVFKPTLTFNKDTGKFEEIPAEKQKEMLCKDALAPCPIVNECLGGFVGLTIEKHSPEAVTQILDAVKSNPEAMKAVNQLRDIAIHGEEEMEKTALATTKIVAEMPEFRKEITRLSKQRLKKEKELDETFEATPADEKFARTAAVFFDYPTELKTKAINLLTENGYDTEEKQNALADQLREKRETGTALSAEENKLKTALLHKDLYPFPYFANYPDLAGTETRLIQIPLKVAEKPEKYSDVETLFASKAKIQTQFTRILSQGGNDSEKASKISDYVNANPKYFGVQDLSKKTILFAGGGSCPFTAICHAVQTGAKVKIIEIDRNVVKEVRGLLPILASVDIIDDHQIEVIHGDAGQFKFKKAPQRRKEVSDSDTVIHADHVAIASAIPPQVTKRILKNLGLGVNRPTAGKRDVAAYALTDFLYYRSNISPKKVISETGNPQGVIGTNSESVLGKILALTNPENVNTFALLKEPKLSKIYAKAQSHWFVQKVKKLRDIPFRPAHSSQTIH